MPILSRLRDFLEVNDVEYEIQDHDPGYSALHLAEAVHIKGRDVAKVVIVRCADDFLMLVLPATHRVEVERLDDALGVNGARLATEEEFRSLFPHCEVGAMPPFGNLFDLPVCVDRALTHEKRIVCPAGNHQQSIVLPYEEFHVLVQPKIVDVAVHI